MRKLKNATEEKVVSESLLSVVEVNFAEDEDHELDFIWRQDRETLTGQDPEERRDLRITDWFLASFATINAHQ